MSSGTTTDSSLGVAIIGYGLSGRVFHAPLVATTPGLEVRSIVTSDPSRQEQARADHPRARVLSSATDLWESAGGDDIVVVATSTGSHGDLASRALEQGMAVVVEKPLAPTAAKARSIVELAEERGAILSVFHNRRWDSDHLTLLRILGEGALGEVMRYESRFERWRPQASPGAWREDSAPADGGGVLLDLGVHLVDQARMLFGPVSSVYGEVTARRGGGDDDVYVALEHSSGVRSHLWASAVSAAPGPRLRVLGSEGAFVVEHLDGQEEALRAGQRPDDPSFGQEPEERWGRLVHGDAGTPVPSEAGRWLDFYIGLERAMTEGTPVPVEARDALEALEVLDAVRRSAQERAVVHTSPSN